MALLMYFVQNSETTELGINDDVVREASCATGKVHSVHFSSRRATDLSSNVTVATLVGGCSKQSMLEARERTFIADAGFWY
jgi:hypothetical protein